MCRISTCSVRGICADIGRGISEERYQTSYHVRNLKNGNGSLFLWDTWLTYLKKLQFMLTETREISNLRKNVAEFSNKFFHFQYATLEMFQGALNYYTMLKLVFDQHLHFCSVLNNVSHQYYATNEDTKPHILLQICP